MRLAEFIVQDMESILVQWEASMCNRRRPRRFSQCAFPAGYNAAWVDIGQIDG